MRTLILLRHAKTESFNINGDKARELTERGRNDAANTGMALRADNVQHVLCSSSMRTRQTYENLGLTMPDGSPVPVEYMDALYFGGTDEMLQRIGEIDDDITSLLVIGHAPTIPSLSVELAWASKGRDADSIACHFPTSFYSRFSIPMTWAELAQGDFTGVEALDENAPTC